MSRSLLVLHSDTHAGSSLGLCLPGVSLPDPNTGADKPVALSPFQAKLAGWWQEDVERVRRLAGGAPVIGIHVGDATQGVRFPTELIATSATDQVTIALNNLHPWLALPNLERYIQIAGTDVHEMGESAAAVAIVRQLRDRYPRVATELSQHALLPLGEELFDLAHHGPPPGGRHWLAGNVLRLYVQSLMDGDLFAGQRPPTFVARGHYHTHVVEYVRRGRHLCRAVILPSWCHPNIHARKATRSTPRAQFGTVVLELEAGRITEMHEWIRTIDTRHRVVIAPQEVQHADY